jgi:hypothetical protein
MASPTPRRFPLDDDDRPSGSVQPLSQADLQAILAHRGDKEPDQLLAGTDADRPVVALRVRASVGRPGGSAHATWRRLRAAEWTAWTRSLPWRVAVPTQPRRRRLAARRGGGATHRPTARPAGTARLGGPARPGRPGQPGQHRSPGDRPRWGGRDRLPAVPGPPPARPMRATVPRPLPARPHAAGGGLRSRPGRRGAARPGPGRGACRGRPRRPGPWARSSPTGCRWWRPGACPACFAPSRWCSGPAGRRSSRPRPHPLPRRRLTGKVAGPRSM